MSVDTNSWNYQDFLAFLMVYAAHADFRVNDKEKAYIREKVGESDFERMVNFYKDLNDVQRIDILIDFKKRFCHTEEDLKAIFTDFLNVLQEDHTIDAEEEAVFVGLRHLLKNID